MESLACAYEGCNKGARHRGYCDACYARLRRHGVLPKLTPEMRLFSKVESDGTAEGCWLWSGTVAPTGYGQIRWGGKVQYAHRVIYGYLISDIPDGLELDHLCRVRQCVNPWHLDPVPHQINVIRGDAPRVNGDRTHCIRGHAFSEENTYTYRGSRQCRACRRLRYGREGTNALPLDASR
ncbi:HNH endonuclease [Streptomyces anthocyanicus]|uniref:HNH endonuclease n=1 Tax=Streptomyces anthocyanicus TaxID=68174 RepID=UPI00386DB708